MNRSKRSIVPLKLKTLKTIGNICTFHTINYCVGLFLFIIQLLPVYGQENYIADTNTPLSIISSHYYWAVSQTNSDVAKTLLKVMEANLPKNPLPQYSSHFNADFYYPEGRIKELIGTSGSNFVYGIYKRTFRRKDYDAFRFDTSRPLLLNYIEDIPRIVFSQDYYDTGVINSNIADWFLFPFDANRLQAYTGDEFEMQRLKKKLKGYDEFRFAQFTSNVLARGWMTPTQTLIYPLQAELVKYDFEKQGYELKVLDEQSGNWRLYYAPAKPVPSVNANIALRLMLCIDGHIRMLRSMPIDEVAAEYIHKANSSIIAVVEGVPCLNREQKQFLLGQDMTVKDGPIAESMGNPSTAASTVVLMVSKIHYLAVPAQGSIFEVTNCIVTNPPILGPLYGRKSEEKLSGQEANRESRNQQMPTKEKVENQPVVKHAPLVIPSKAAEVINLVKEAVELPPSGFISEGQTYEGFNSSKYGRTLVKVRMHVDSIQAAGPKISNIIVTITEIEKSNKSRVLQGNLIEGNSLKLVASIDPNAEASSSLLGGIIKVNGQPVSSISNSLFDNNAYSALLILNSKALVGSIPENGRILYLRRKD